VESREITGFITTLVKSPTIQLPLGSVCGMTDNIGFSQGGAQVFPIFRALHQRRRLGESRDS